MRDDRPRPRATPSARLRGARMLMSFFALGLTTTAGWAEAQVVRPGPSAWNPAAPPSAAREAARKTTRHGERQNLEAGVALRHTMRDVQRAPQIDALRRDGSADDLARFENQVRAEDGIDRRTTRQELRAFEHRRVQREIDSLGRLLLRPGLGALSRGLITERRAELLEIQRAWETDATLRALEREISQRDAGEAPDLSDVRPSP